MLSHARHKFSKTCQQKRKSVVFSSGYHELWRDGGVGRVQKHRALRLVERAVSTAYAEWGAEYVADEFIEGWHSRSGRSSAGCIFGVCCYLC